MNPSVPSTPGLGNDSAKVESLTIDPVVLQRMIAELVTALQTMRQENAALRQRLDALVQRFYGPRSRPDNPQQLLLFPEVPPAAAPPQAESAAVAPPTEPLEAEAPTGRRRRGHGRRRLEELLPRLPVERIEHVLTEAERTCPCCGGLRDQIGEQTTQQLDYQPARLIRVEHAQFTYSCPHCPEHIVTAPKPPQPIDRGLPGPGLLAAIATHKYDEHVPLYRQELSRWRDGLFLARSTTCTWMAAVAALLRPLVECMKQELLQSRVIQTDSTGVPVLIDGHDATQTGQLWVYLSEAEPGYVVVDFSVDHKKEHPQQFLADYTGYVQADAHAGYDGLFAPGAAHPKVEVGCWAHAHRYFEAARVSDPALACQALGFTGALFDIEAQARKDHRSEAEMQACRQRASVPILADFHKWLEATAALALPKSPLGEAVRYACNQWPALQRYTEAGFLEMTNNASERMNKIIARGRINWLFVGSPQGGVTAAILFSITTTCRRLEIDAFAYLRDLLTRLPSQPPDRLDELLPDRWRATHPEARYPPQRRQATTGPAP
jgi:transposase